MSVKIRRERPDQRRHHRVTAPLFVEIGDVALRAVDWSLGGLKVSEYPAELPEVGSELELQLTLPFQGFDVSFRAVAEVMRLEPASRAFAVQFVEIGERERELMQHFIEELVRGSMVDVEDTIQRIDVPVTPASLEPDAGRKALAAPVPVRRLPVKTIVMTLIYGVIGFFVFGYAGLLGYSNFFRLEVPTAVISAPVETVAAQNDGHVRWNGVKPGDEVRAGEIIVDLIDSALQREIDFASIAVEEQKARMASLKKRHLEELERIRGYATVEMKNILQTRAELEALQAQLKIAEGTHARLRQLADKGFATAPKLEEAERMAISLRKEVQVRRIELEARVELSEQNVGKRMYSGNQTIGSADISGKAGEIEADIRLAEHEIQLAQQRYVAYLKQRDSASVRSPFDGTILELPRLDKGSVRKGDTIAVIEQRRERFVTAYLNQDEVLSVGLGDGVQIYVPALGETLKGHVERVDRTSGFVREQDQRQVPGYNWRGPTDRSAKVVIAFDNPRQVADVQRYRSGLPVVAVFERRSTNSLVSAVKKQLSLAM